MAFRKKSKEILRYNPDILIIQECEKPEKFKAAEIITNCNQFLWFGKNEHKGVGVLTFNNYQASLCNTHKEAYEYIIPIDISGDQSFKLYAIWAMAHKIKTQSYVGQIWKAIQYYGSAFEQESIIVGDWNSNAQWNNLRPNGNHGHVVKFLDQFNISSVYHKKNKIQHGEEIDPTLFLLKNVNKPFHIDYCFASNKLITSDTKINIGVYEEWIQFSDHMPLIIDNLIN